jgi:hypothetical protein
MNILKKILLAALCCTNIACAQPTFYQTLGDAVLRAEETLETTATQPERRQAAQLKEAPQPAPVEAQPQVDLTVKIPSHAEQLKLWFSVIDQTIDLKPAHLVFNESVAEKLGSVNQII